MAAPPGGPQSPAPQTRFSADGFWWWDGAEWRPAFSQDRRWRWTGQGWVPAHPAMPAGAGTAAGVTIGLIAAFMGVLVLISIVVIAVLLTMGNQITNVFSNVIAALGP